MFYRTRKILPIYDSLWLDIVVSDDVDKLNEEFGTNCEHYYACVMRHNFKQEGTDIWRKSIVVVLNPNEPYGAKITSATITHESIHVKNMIFQTIGYRCQTDNDEAEAYLTEFLFNVIRTYYKKVLKKEKKLTLKTEENGPTE